MYITFEELRRIEDTLPQGSTFRIAKELNIDEQDVRDYFSGYDHSSSSRVEIYRDQLTLTHLKNSLNPLFNLSNHLYNHNINKELYL